MVRKLLIGVAVAVVLVVGGLLALATFVDVDRFKPQIENIVQEKLHRRLTIDGKLSLSVFPRIAVALPPTRLSDLAGKQDAASLQGARITVALFPLLSGRIEADTIRIDGLKATLEKRADGTTNFDDLIGRGGKAGATPSPAPAAAPGAGGKPPEFAIGGVELTNAELTYVDRASNATYALAPLNLKTGPLANVAQTPLALDVHFTATQPKATGDLSVKGTLDVDMPQGKFGAAAIETSLKATVAEQPVAAKLAAARIAFDASSGAVSVEKLDATASGTSGGTTLSEAHVVAPALAYDPVRKTLAVGGLDVKAKGKLDADTFDASLSAPKIEASASAASGERIQGAFKLAGSRSVDATLLVETLGGTLNQMTIGKLGLQADVHEGGRSISAKLASPATASVENQALALTQLTADIAIDDPAAAQKSIKLPISGLVAVDGHKQAANAKLFADFDQSKISLVADVRGFAKPHVDFDLDVDRIDVDRYLPPSPPPRAGAAATPAAPAAGGSAAAADEKLDLSPLKPLDVDGHLKAGALKVHGLSASNVRVDVKAAGGRLELAPIAAQLYGGTLNASASAAADGNHIAAKAALASISIGPLLKDLIQRDLIDGHGNVDVDVTTAGPTVGALRKGLDGHAGLALHDGAIKGINVAQKIRDAQSLVASGGATESKGFNDAEKTDFTELSASFAIRNGVASSNDLDAKSPLLRLGGEGSIDLVSDSLDYTAKVSVVGTLTGQSGRDLSQLRGVTVPVHLSGPFDKLAYSIEWKDLATQLAKAKATEALKSAVGGQVMQQRDQLKSQAKDALKGLLGK